MFIKLNRTKISFLKNILNKNIYRAIIKKNTLYLYLFYSEFIVN